MRLEIGPWQPSLVVVEAAAAPPHRVDAILTTEATPFAFAATEVEAEAGEDFLPSTVAGDTLRSQARAWPQPQTSRIAEDNHFILEC